MRPAVRRWLIVAALFTTTYGTSIPFAAYGVFLPILAETFGWSRGAISTALSLNLILGGVVGFALGVRVDRHGPRGVLILTVALAGAAFALIATVGALWQLYLFVGVLGGVGMSSFYLLSTATVARWFVEHRGLALALVLVGFNLGFISAGPLAAWLITTLGWRAAYAVLGSVCGLVTILAAFGVRLPRGREIEDLRRSAARAGGGLAGTLDVGGSPSTVAADVTLREALVDPRQWCLNVAWLLLGGTYVMLAVHIVPFARDQGIALAAASLSLTGYGIGAVTGRLAAGVVSDLIGSPATTLGAYVVQVLALAALLWASSAEMLVGSMLAFGLGLGAADTMLVRAVPEVFGVRAIGAIMGVLTLGWRSGAALGPAAAGFLYDLTGSYAVPFGAAPAVIATSWVLVIVASSRRSRKARRRSLGG
jgi:MFS family permease